jgi:methionine--tRNA ligase beta chain
MNTERQTIKYDDFAKIDIRVGTITHAEKVENSEKLIKLTVDLGELGIRQILTGMQKWYSPQDFINLQTLFLVNLEPRKMAGLESQGMMLSAELDDSKKPILITLNEPAQNGEGIS